jgi:molybdate transport system permease protein
VPPLYLGLSAADWQALWLSVRIAAAAVVLSLPPGIAFGWLLARRTFTGKAAVETVLSLPLVLPPVVTGLLLLYALGPGSTLGAWLQDSFGLRIAFTWRAAVIAVAVVGFPLLVRSVRVAFEGIDPRLYQAARSLGAGRLDAFWSVSLPLARNGVIAGLVLAFARGLGEFGATMMFASIRPETTTLAIQIYLLHNQPGDLSEERMWRVVVASVLLAFSALVVSEYLVRRGRQYELA